MMDQLGHIPHSDENAMVTYENVTLTIQSMDDKRIEQILVHIDPTTDSEFESSDISND